MIAMYHYQLMLVKDWANRQVERENNTSSFYSDHNNFSLNQIIHFYGNGYDDIVKKLVADPNSCKDFYKVLQQVGLSYQTYYHHIPDKVTQTLKNALAENKVVLLARTGDGLYTGESNKTNFNPFGYSQSFKRELPYESDDSWLIINLVNHHQPVNIQLYDAADNRYILQAQTSDNEIFLRHSSPFSSAVILPKVHVFLGGVTHDNNLIQRGTKLLRVKQFAQLWLDDLCALLVSGNSPFITEHNNALASQINHHLSHNIKIIRIDKQSCMRTDETIGYFFWSVLELFNDTRFLSPIQRMGDCSSNESEGAIFDVEKLKQSIKSLSLIKCNDDLGSSDDNYHNQELANVARRYILTPITTDGQGDENDYETKLSLLTSTYFESDNLINVQTLFFNAVKLLKYLRESGLVRHVETRREYKIKATQLDYEYIKIPPSRIRLDAEKLLKCANEVCEKHLYHEDIKASFIDNITDFATDIVQQVENDLMKYEEGSQKIAAEERSLWEQSIEWVTRGLSVLGGTGLIMAGVAMCTTGVGCIVGAYLATHGINSIQEGVTGNDGFLRASYQEGAKQLGMSASVGDLAYDMIDLGVSVKGKLKLVPKLDDFGDPVRKLWYYGRQDLVRMYNQMNNWLLKAEIASDMISLNSVIEEVKNIIVFDKATQETSIGISEPENIKNVGEVIDSCEYVILITFEDNPKYKGYYRCTNPNYRPIGEGM